MVYFLLRNSKKMDEIVILSTQSGEICDKLNHLKKSTGYSNHVIVKEVAHTVKRWIIIVYINHIRKKSLLEQIKIAFNHGNKLIEQVIPVEENESAIPLHHLLPGKIHIINNISELQFYSIENPFITMFLECFATIEELSPPITVMCLHSPQWGKFEGQEIEQGEKIEIILPAEPSLLAKKLISEREAAQSSQRFIIVPSGAVSHLIGRQGKTIEQLRRQTCAQIKIMSDNKSPEMHSMQSIRIRGQIKEVEVAQQLLEVQIAEWRSKNTV